ncbi:MAG: hypothetical protein DMG14_01055, partial [Acidobacteria bacterium]
VLRYSNVTPDWKRAQIWVKSLNTNHRKLLLENALDARYVDGYLVFARQTKLFAVSFDPKKLSVSGDPIPVLDGVVSATYGRNVDATTGAAQFTVSETGTLVYAPGSIDPPILSPVVWVDRKGTAAPIAARPMSRLSVRVSNDGRIAFSENYVDRDIWILDPIRGTQERQTSEG